LEVQDGEEGPTVPAWRVHRVAHGSPRPGAGKKSTGGRERDKAVQVLGQTLASLHRPEAVKEAEAYRDTVTLAHYAAGHLEKKAVARRAATVDRDRRSLGLRRGSWTRRAWRIRTESIHPENGSITLGPGATGRRHAGMRRHACVSRFRRFHRF